MPKDKMTFEELNAYCRIYKDVIYVRALVDGKWGSHTLDELPESTVSACIQHWHLEGKVPSIEV